LPTSGNARCRPTPNEPVVTTDAWAYAVVGRQVRRKGHLKVPGVEIRRAALGGSHGWASIPVESILGSILSGPVVDAQTSLPQEARGCIACDNHVIGRAQKSA
jgi:hypothetical protein